MTIDLSASFKAYDVRGIVGETITLESAEAVGAAFVDVLQLAGQRVLLGGDMRPSSPALAAQFAAGATARGADVTDLGLVSTDMLYFASGMWDAPGVVFTASHNPAGYNGMKMSRAGAVPLSADTGLLQIRDVAQSYLNAATTPVSTSTTPATATPVSTPAHTAPAPSVPAPPSPGPSTPTQSTLTQSSPGHSAPGLLDLPRVERPGRVESADVLADYAAYLRSLVDLAGIRPLKVVVDAANGMAGMTTPAVLSDAELGPLPLEVIPLYFELDGTFPHHPANPLEPENLLDLQRAVVRNEADIGLAFDGDADRCFVVDETGTPVSPSAVTALVAHREITRAQAAGEETPSVVHNLITSQAVPEVVESSGGRAVETRVGHSFIKAVMAQESAVFGGEHSAHYYFRDFYYADTGMLATLHVLAALGEQHLGLSSLVAAYNPYAASGEINSTVEDPAGAMQKVEEAFSSSDVIIDYVDGLRIRDVTGSWWFNLRPSNTEPFLRYNGEADTADVMTARRDEVLRLIRES